MSSDPLLHRLTSDLDAQAKVKTRVKRRVLQRIRAQEAGVLNSVLPEPSAATKNRIWQRIQTRIAADAPTTVLEKVRDLLSPPVGVRRQLSQQIALRMRPQVHHAIWPQRMLKFASALVVIALVVGLSPTMFIASPTVAESVVSLVPTRGDVSISVGGLWQPVTDELTIVPGMLLRTEDGEASILFHDDGVVRLDANTTIKVHDTANRTEPAAPDVLPTVTLYTGRLWVQGLVPSYVRGLTVTTSYGHITVNEGSVSIAEDDVVDVLVFDRRAQVTHGGDDLMLVAGERTQMWEGNIPLVKKITASRYEQVWPEQNLARDAVHRREIAQMQQERRAAQAGILPTSRLYSMKRAAERVDVLLTFDDEARTQKKIHQAQTRLNEAAALIAEDQADVAEQPLHEYRQMLVALAAEDDGSMTQLLLQQSLTEASAAIAAAQPDDNAYQLKLAVLEASTALDSSMSAKDLEGILLMDSLASLSRSLEQGNLEEVRSEWVALQPHLALLDIDEEETEVLQEDVRKEILALLARVAGAVDERSEEFAAVDPEFVEQVSLYQPADPTESEVASLSEEELEELVQGIRDRIFVYHMQRSRINQLVAEITALAGHPEEGRILRRLYTELPEGPENFPERIRKEITRLRWEMAAETI